MTRDALATLLDHTFRKALEAWGCDFVRDASTWRPWVVATEDHAEVYVGIKGRAQVVAEVRVGTLVPVVGIQLDPPKVLTDAIYRASLEASEFPPFYVE